MDRKAARKPFGRKTLNRSHERHINDVEYDPVVSAEPLHFGDSRLAEFFIAT